METQDTCLYIHTRKNDGGIFYIGIGDEKRPYSKANRNQYWNNVVNKYDYNVTILKTNMSWEKACDLEIKMIAFYGRIIPYKENLNYGCLVNMSDGGEGNKGAVWSEESRLNHSGKKNPFFEKTHSDKFKKKKSEISIGGKNPKARKVICGITGKIYECIKDASEDIGINYFTLHSYLCGSRPNKTSLRYI
jgi:hypothetical protein